MFRCTVNIAFLFSDRLFLECVAAGRAAGFEWVECLFPYDHSIDDLSRSLAQADVQMTGLNTAPGSRPDDWGLTGVTGREAEFSAGFEQVLSRAMALRASVIHVMAGIVPQGKRTAARSLRHQLALGRRASSGGERYAGSGAAQHPRQAQLPRVPFRRGSRDPQGD